MVLIEFFLDYDMWFDYSLDLKLINKMCIPSMTRRHVWYTHFIKFQLDMYLHLFS